MCVVFVSTKFGQAHEVMEQEPPLYVVCVLRPRETEGVCVSEEALVIKERELVRCVVSTTKSHGPDVV